MWRCDVASSRSERRPRLEKWITVTGPNAYCSGCPWSLEGDLSDSKAGKRVMSAARFHARDTGHTIQVQRGQSAVLR
jgi:hypothetical protein